MAPNRLPRPFSRENRPSRWIFSGLGLARRPQTVKNPISRPFSPLPPAPYSPNSHPVAPLTQIVFFDTIYPFRKSLICAGGDNCLVTYKMKSFPIDKAYADDAAKILGARAAGAIHHVISDIRASGDTVEVATRDFLHRRLPLQYHVGHGHIVDNKLTTSPQLDVIVADSNAMPVLFEGEHGVQYIPYESVYLFGEVKSSYSNAKKYIHNFADTQSRILNELEREKTPNTYIGNGISLGSGLKSGVSVPYQNPLFSFMLFADKGDFNVESIIELYSTTDHRFLPNIVVFLDGLVIAQSEITAKANRPHLGSLILDSHMVATCDNGVWCLMRFEGNAHPGASVLALLILALHVHLSTCRLLIPPIEEYLQHIFRLSTRYADILDYRKILEIMEKAGLPVPQDAKNLKLLDLISGTRKAMKNGK